MERPDLFVVARILDRIAAVDGPVLKTRLQTACNLNYDTFLRYLEWMSERDLVEVRARQLGGRLRSAPRQNRRSNRRCGASHLSPAA